ncbi:hypothetical protein EDC94DRAFT_604632 [Helicostylum pulchrum]|nr:hypothetical protein EDC94DRAFT_604632 [Helicostylum pulchrum]
MSSSHASKHIKEWLPMPSGLSFTDNSFSVDLIEQFDKRRSQLNSDVISIEEQQQGSIHSFASSIQSIPKIKDNDSSIRRSSSLNRFHDNTQQIEQPRAETIFNSWTLKKKKKFHNRHVKEIIEEPPLSKIAINTTISISPNNINNQYTDNMIQAPIITQYPPKPLKYSPVEPLPAEAYAGSDQHTRNRNTLKRLSLPLLKLTAASQTTTAGNTLHRRRSDSDLLNQQNQSNHTFFRSLSKRWNKLLNSCKSKRIKNKKSAA